MAHKRYFAVLGLCCVALFFAVCETSLAQSSSAGVDLFNGKDFIGWTFYMRSNSAPEKTWSITNGVIHCSGRPSGFMRTEKDYSNYHLTVEWRFLKVTPKANNTGVLVHMQPQERIWPECVECQGQDQKQGDFWLHNGTTASGFPWDGKKSTHVPMPVPPNEKPTGEWNTYEVIARADTVEIIVNGKSMNKIEGCNLTSGNIGIQSEGGDIEVRKILLQPLN
jgi:hypothetical protein